MPSSTGNWQSLDLEDDPVRGDPSQVREVATRLLREAQLGDQLANELTSIAAGSGDLQMEGDYAPGFHNVLERLPAGSASLSEAYLECGRALSAYADTLEQTKARSAAALSEGTQADEQYQMVLRQFYTVSQAIPSPGGVWRGLNEQSAAYLSQNQDPAVQAQAIRLGSFGRQAEEERQNARNAAMSAGQMNEEAEARCAQAIQAASPHGFEGGGRVPSGQVPAVGGIRAWLRQIAARVQAGLSTATNKFTRNKTCETDPIDVATGDVVLSQIDVRLPGVLPLVLERTHVSSYRAGRWFGPSWSSTLDQRLEVDEQGVVLVATEGVVLEYPPPADGAQVLPLKGPRWRLHLGKDGYTVTDPQTGRTLHFQAQPRAAAPSVQATVLPLKAITDRNGNRVDLDYDDTGVLTAIRHSGGYRIAVDTADDRVTALRLLTRAGSPNGDSPQTGSPADEPAEEIVLKRFGYDNAGLLDEVFGSSDQPTRFEYDPAGRMTRWTDTNGCWYAYTYDDQGHAIAGTGAEGILNATFDYEPQCTVMTDSFGHQTTYQLNEDGQVIAVIDPLGHTTTTTYDQNNLLLSHTDPLNHSVRYTYDHNGNITSVTQADGTSLTATYNDLALPEEVVQPDGTIWRHDYDQRGNLTAQADPTGATTTYTYDDHSRLTTTTDPLGNTTRLQNDTAGLPVTIIDPRGATTTLTRDGLGRVTEVTDPVGGITRLTWTTEGQLASRTLPDGATERWTYDGEGNLTEYTDAIGQATHTEIGAFDLPTVRTGPDGARLQFTYDTALRLTTVTNPQGLVWRYVYDAAGNLTSEIDFNGRTLTYTHDPARRLASRTNGADETTTFAHDASGNVVEKRSGDTVTTFTYDTLGRLLHAANLDADLRLERDPLGRVLAETCNGRTLTSAYDAGGNRVYRRTPSGAESTWTYDAAGFPASLHTARQTITFDHDAVGRETQRRIGSDGVLTQQWDPAHRLTSQSIWGPTTPNNTPATDDTRPVDGMPVPVPGAASTLLQRRTYTYRPDGNIIAIGDHLSGGRHYDLDPAGRITAVTAQNWAERYAYDTAGNVADATWPALQTATPQEPDTVGERQYSGTLIRRAGRVRYEYDRQGRMVLRQHARLSSKPHNWRYEWDTEDRLVGVRTPDGQRWRYVYDPLGRRIAKQRLSTDGTSIPERVDFAWDGTTLAEERNSVSNLNGKPRSEDGKVWNHEPGTYRPVTQTQRKLRDAPQEWTDEQFYAVITDLVGSPAELVSPSDGIVWRSTASIWGNDIVDRSVKEAPCPLRFPGQYRDSETGLDYNYRRYYDPQTARFVSSDPLGLTSDLDPYGYVQNPLLRIDPLGLISNEDCETNGGRGPLVLGIGPHADALAHELSGYNYNGPDYDKVTAQIKGVPWTQWMFNVRNDLRNNSTVAVSLNGFDGDDPYDMFMQAYNAGRRPGWRATEWEMAQIGEMVQKKSLDWDNITFYCGNKVEPVQKPEGW